MNPSKPTTALNTTAVIAVVSMIATKVRFLVFGDMDLRVKGFEGLLAISGL